MQGFDLLLLAFKGIAIASLPIALVWVGRAPKNGDRLRRLAWVTVFITFDLIVFGGFTRLTDSGLGCPDWPGCYAKANPLMASQDIHSAESAMPYGPVSMTKAWIEMIHRYLAMAVGVLIVTMLVVSVRRGWRRRSARSMPQWMPPAEPGLVTVLLGLVMLQGAFGAWTVTQKLQPIFVSTHLLLGLALLALLIVHALKLDDGAHLPVASRQGVAGLRVFAALSLVVLVLQIALGGWVSANYAVLACSEFPKCQGVWLPDMDFANGFHLWRELGKSADGGYLSIAALTAIHWVHRTFAWVVVILLAALGLRIRRIDGLARSAVILWLLLATQFATGLVNVVFAWPLVAAVLHNAGAAALLATLVVINYRLPRPSPSAQRVRSRGSVPTAPGRSVAKPSPSSRSPRPI